ncbi:hypothetical protein [Massilia genomosp. 1]|uniref:Uncharacterized protein n=1 Tax=Massilia genomosp. 1 TaxID=2609280 RepID=A0ABX0MLG3_9BURK|nr:hypothetical protein [Massilia genomosp. 1]NHZ61296.1 hypothetical protein [Massilia genomosp. 1]
MMSRTSIIAFTPVLALLAAICLFELPQSYWCTPIEIGGKELACGYDYARPVLKFAIDMLFIVGASGIVASLVFAFQRRLSKPGGAGFILSVLIAIACFYLKAYLGVDDSP